MKTEIFKSQMSKALLADDRVRTLLAKLHSPRDRSLALNGVVDHISVKVPVVDRRSFLTAMAVPALAIPLMASAPVWGFGKAEAIQLGIKLLGWAVDLLQGLIVRAEQRLAFTQRAQDVAYGAPQDMLGPNGDLLYFDRKGALPPSQSRIDSRTFSFIPSNVGNGSVGSLHATGRPPENGSLRAPEARGLTTLEHRFGDASIVPTRTWDGITARDNPTALNNRLIDNGMNPRDWAVVGQRRWAPTRNPRDDGLVLQALNQRTSESVVFV